MEGTTRMAHYKYLIVGGGMAAAAAIRGIRDLDPEGTIGLISAEGDPPFRRPPLSKALWKGKPLDSVWNKLDDMGVSMHLHHTVSAIDPQKKEVTDRTGNTYGYDKLLLATGGTPRKLPYQSNHIVHFRTVDDYRHLRALADHGERFAVIGGGFIGSEF